MTTNPDAATRPSQTKRRSVPFMAAALCASLLLVTGCVTTPRGEHSVPIARDYQDLARTDLAEAEDAVLAARRAGAAGFAPHAYASAENYLALAWAAHRNRDHPGTWDYATLAVRYAKAALAESPAVPPPVADDTPPNQEAALRAFERLYAEWTALDHERASFALPILFADLTAALSRIEYDLNRGEWEQAARLIPSSHIMARTLQTRDIDRDGIPDIDDPDPWQPEVEEAPPPPPPLLRPVGFGSGSATLDAESHGYLQAIADRLIESPEWTLHVKGHTDNRHSEAYNLDLSRRRAQAVYRYLVSAGAPAERITVSHYGSASPVEPSPAGVASAANRRVELLLE